MNLSNETQKLIKQAIFGVLFQEKPSMVVSENAILDGDCMYRNADGCRCAVGWVIPDVEYEAEMEQEGVFNIADKIWNWPNEDVFLKFLNMLQSAHDEACDNPEHFIEQFKGNITHLVDEEFYDFTKKILEEWEVEGKILFTLRDAIIATYNQGEKSWNDSVGCAYRTQRDDGCIKCLVGHMIPDEEYKEQMEGIPFDDSPEFQEILEKTLGIPQGSIKELGYLETITNLQICHDRADGNNFKEGFKFKLSKFLESGGIPIYFAHTLHNLK